MRFQEVWESASLSRSSGSGTMIRSWPFQQWKGSLAIEVKLRGAKGDRAEGEGGPACSRAGRRVDPEGGKIPEGEWRSVARRGSVRWKRQRAVREEAAVEGRDRKRQWSGRPNGRWKLYRSERSSRSGTLTLGWRLREGAAVLGERKAVTSEGARRREKAKAAASREAAKPGVEKTPRAEPSGESLGALRCNA